MKLTFLRVSAVERYRFGLLVTLFFLNSVILESNEVIATSGFISNIGVQHVIWVWAVDMLIVMLTAALYSIVVDRMNRTRLTVAMFATFGCGYLVLYKLFQFEHLEWLTYPLLTIINDQQWSLFALLIWALANDAYSTSQAKRLFPLLAMAVMIGSIFGNATVAFLPHILQTPGYILLLVNAFLMILLSTIIWTAAATYTLFAAIRPARRQEQLRDVFTEGVGFIRDVPSFRYLAFAMIPLGLGLNALEFYFLSIIVSSDTVAVQTIYGTFKVVLAVSILLVQALLVTKLVDWIGLRRIFALMPAALLTGLLLVFAWPLYGIFLANYLVRVTLVAVDEPARQMLYGFAPDERRGRVSAFMNGYLYPLGAIIGCLVIGLVLYCAEAGYVHAMYSTQIYLSIAFLAVSIAFGMVFQIHKYYDISLLSWRLERRKRGSTIPKLDFS